MTLFGKGRKFALKQYTSFLQNVEIAVGHGPKGPKCPTHISLLKLFLPDTKTNMRQFVCKAKLLCRLLRIPLAKFSQSRKRSGSYYDLDDLMIITSVSHPITVSWRPLCEMWKHYLGALSVIVKTSPMVRLQLYKTPTFGWQADVADLGKDGLPGVRRQGRGLRSRYGIDIT